MFLLRCTIDFCYLPGKESLSLSTLVFKEPGSSVSIVSGYGLDGRSIGVRSSAGAKDFFSSLCVQTGSGAHPASCPMGTGGFYRG
jgi:hypothetical protein